MLFRHQKFLKNSFFLYNFSKKKNYIRNLFITRSMLNKKFAIYTGKFFFELKIKPDMLNFRIQDFLFTKKKAKFITKASKLQQKNKKR